MKKIFGLLFMTAVMMSCSNAQEEVNTENVNDEQTITLVGKAEFQQLMKNDEAQLVDVRTPGEVSRGKIGDAVNINVHDADFKTQLSKLDKNKPVLVYCAAGSRSAKAVSIMKGMGFSEIHELKGGYNAW